MHRLLILVMIVLLPLRGWAGDLMSVQMAASGSGVVDAMPADCPMFAKAGAGDDESGHTQALAGMDNCASCELCIPMAQLPCTRLVCASFAAHAQPLMERADFISALPAPTLKPPIS